MLRRALETLVLPPLSCLVLAGAGVVIGRWRPRLGRAVLVAAAALLWLLSTPLVAAALLCLLQREPALDLAAGPQGAEAIVVLSADWVENAPEFGGATVGGLTLQRLRYAAALQRATGVPVLVSGGPPEPGAVPLGEAMRATMERELGVPVRWVETRSVDTWGNARHSAEILAAHGVGRAWLVTHAWHMPRARRAFEACGVTVIPAPTAFRTLPTDPLRALLPRWDGLRDTALALHELLGAVYYELFHH